jgi:hypothetical protein
MPVNTEFQMATLFKSSLRIASVALGITASTLSTSASALTMTLPTTNLNAMSTFSFNSDVQDIMSNMGMYVGALGNSQQVKDGIWSFDMPVTQVSLNASLIPLSLTPVSGKATGSALGIYSEEGALQLANFSLDFKRNVLQADLITTAGTTKNFDVYNFKVDQGLHLSTSGGLSMKMALTNMMLTTGAQSAFTQALALPTFASAILGNMDFGRLDINISPSLRFGVSDKPYTATMVPEAPSVGMFALGLLGIAITARRRLRPNA